jgi:hypothetical protein
VTAGQNLKLRGAHGAALLEALAAKDRATLRGAEGNRSFLTALRAAGFGFRANRRRRSAYRFGALGLAGFAAFGLILEALVGEKHLFAGSEHKFRTALRALQNLIVVFHGSVPPWTPKMVGTRRLCYEGPRKTAET